MDLTSLTGQVAIVPTGTRPASGDWVAGEWTRTPPQSTTANIDRVSTEFRYNKITATVDGATDSAWLRVLVGPDGAISPAPGKVDHYVKVTADPEKPAINTGTYNVT